MATPIVFLDSLFDCISSGFLSECPSDYDSRMRRIKLGLSAAMEFHTYVDNGQVAFRRGDRGEDMAIVSSIVVYRPSELQPLIGKLVSIITTSGVVIASGIVGADGVVAIPPLVLPLIGFTKEYRIVATEFCRFCAAVRYIHLGCHMPHCLFGFSLAEKTVLLDTSTDEPRVDILERLQDDTPILAFDRDCEAADGKFSYLTKR